VPTPEEKAQFIEAAKPLKEWYAKKYGKEWLDKLEAAIKQAKMDLEKRYAQELN
jgi:hypothetical protein